MKAIVITSPGGPEVLKWQERPTPTVGPSDVLIEVHAAGINRPDIAQRKGNYPPPASASPDIPGLEVSGVVVETGIACSRFKKGDRVCALLAGGGYAEFCSVPEVQCLPLPTNLSMAEGASLPETYFTVWSNVMDRAALQPTESILIHGGSGGIGTTAIQIARSTGATVFTTAGSDEKCASCIALGAHYAINYKTTNFKDEILQLTSGKGVNVALDMIGGSYTQMNLDVLANDGRLVQINFMKGENVSIGLAQLMRKRLVITGSMLRPRDQAFKGAIAMHLERVIWPLLEQGTIKPVIYKTFPITEAAAAHSLMESGGHTGKIVLLLNDRK